MKKKLKITGIVIIVLTVLMVLFAMVGLQEATNLQLNAVDLLQIADGRYVGAYKNGRFSNTVSVTVKDHVITAIEPIKAADNREQMVRELSNKVIAEQRTNVDGVSGATASSRSFLKAVEAALDGALAK